MADDLVVYALDGVRADSYLYHCSDGHSYHLVRTMRGGRLSLRCCRNRPVKGSCRAKLSCADDGTEGRPGTVHRHNHEPDWNIIHQRRFRTAVLNECRRPENAVQTLKEIYHKVRRDLVIPRRALIDLCYKSLRPAMHRARNETLPPIPHTLNDLANVLEDPDYEFLTTSLDGEDNIYLGKFGSTRLGTRVIVFASRRALGYLERNLDQCEVMSDGTCPSVPRALEGACAQIWTILLVRRHHIIVAVRALMQSKTQQSYETVLRAIRDAAPLFNPRTVMVDFEITQAKAWEAVFVGVIVSGCLFHSSKAISLHAKTIGLAILIRDNGDVDSLIRSLCALALLPQDLIIEGLRTITNKCIGLGYWDQLSGMFEYMYDTWTAPSRLRLLSVHGCPNRTSNACESANATLKSAVRTDHPNVYSFLSALNDLEDVTAFDWSILDAGRNPSPLRRASALANDASIQGYQDDLANGFMDVEMFLANASRRIQNVYNMILDL